MDASFLKTVLVVDDHESIRTTTSLVLEEFGYTVRVVEDGCSALDEINQEVPDILLSDLNMPGMSGRELLSKVRRLYPGIQVVATSGAFGGNHVPEGVLADAFYPKGGGVSRLLQTLRTLSRLNHRPPESLTMNHLD